eukprot:101286-Amphidinium_carterae.1
MGAMPCPDEDLTVEQLTALAKITANQCIPYVDFFTWGLFGYRVGKRPSFTVCGLRMMGASHRWSCLALGL